MQLFASHDYQARLADEFACVASRLRTLLPGAQVEHVGSSSIPGAISRGDLDICVLVNADDFEMAGSAIKSIGYREKSDTLRTGELCMLIPIGPGEAHAIQLVSIGSEFEFFILFRDALRADLQMVAQYNHIKKQSVLLGETAYREAKGFFIRGVLAAGRSPSAVAQRLPANSKEERRQ